MNTPFNNDIDLSEFKNTFAENGKVRVNDVLPFENAAHLYQALSERFVFDNAMAIDGQNIVVSPDEWKALKDEQKKQTYFKLMENAAKGNGFSYGRKYITSDEPDDLIRSFYTVLNSEDVLNVMSDLTGVGELNYASMQVTRFIPGQFLTRHKDVVDAEGRKLAYVFNLSPEWHPDWGGLLQFFNEDGTTSESWTPNFNTLSLFTVENIHSVTYLTPFAKKPRLSITGWFGKR